MQGKLRRRLAKGGLLVGSTLAALLVAELMVRAWGETDADGNFFFRGRRVGPVHPPVSQTRETLRQYRGSNTSRMIYDPLTGWKPRPDSTTHHGMYRYNSRGIRSAPTDYALEPPEGVVRIALFGDSFTHGDDVPFEETWGFYLEQELQAAGVTAEVVNFGVSAYGMDQAFLRWQTLGRQFTPQLVLFGFQAENVGRNVNIFRALYAPGTGIPFTKPRFIFDGTGRIRLVNSPTLPLDEIPHVLAHLQTSELARYEWFYGPAAYREQFWHHSRLLTLGIDVFSGDGSGPTPRSGRLFDMDGEPVRITVRLLQEFRQDAEQHGAEFYVVHLPKEDDVSRLLSGRPLLYRELLARLSEEQRVIDPAARLVSAARNTSLDRLFQRHYSAAGNRVIAGVIAQFLLKRGLAR